MAEEVLTEKAILEKKFPASKNGYNPLEVDKFLDRIVLSVNSLNKEIAKSKSTNEELAKKIKSLEDQIKSLKTEHAIFKNKYKNIKESDFVENRATIDLIKKCNIYEEKLNSLGVDVSKLNK